MQLLDRSKLVRDEKSGGELRITELTPLMVACMMSNMQTARILVEQARSLYLPHSPDDFRLFIDVKMDRSMGGNNALLFSCANTTKQEGARTNNAEESFDSEASMSADQANYMLVKYLIDEAGADPNVQNDTF